MCYSFLLFWSSLKAKASPTFHKLYKCLIVPCISFAISKFHTLWQCSTFFQVSSQNQHWWILLWPCCFFYQKTTMLRTVSCVLSQLHSFIRICKSVTNWSNVESLFWTRLLKTTFFHHLTFPKFDRSYNPFLLPRSLSKNMFLLLFSFLKGRWRRKCNVPWISSTKILDLVTPSL